MLDINHIRREMADYLAANACHRHSLDAAVMHVVQLAYQQGIRDAQQAVRPPQTERIEG